MPLLMVDSHKIAPAIGVGVGFGSEPIGAPEATLDSVLDLIRGVGGRWWREQMTWAAIETADNTFDWSGWDLLVTRANVKGVRLLPVVAGTPGWAHTGGVPTYAPPTSTAQFGAFCGAAAARYSASIKHWEIWNEPNTATFWGGENADPVKYAAMLASAYDAIKAADPSATVISGGMAPAETGSGYYDPRDYLDLILDEGAAAKCDGYGYHPYSYPSRPATFHAQNAWSRMFETTPSLLSVMNDHSARKRLWLTEWGCPTYGTGPGATIANNFGADISPPTPQWGDEAVQAVLADDVIRLARARPDQIAFVSWYNLVDSAAAGVDTDREKHFGLLYQDASPKTAAGAYTAALAATGGQG